jgi:hemerythrin-like domain-containing protein
MPVHDGVRRTFLLGALSAGLVVVGCGKGAVARPEAPGSGKDDDEKPQEKVSPPEDLMREHGVLNRILLIYDESARRLDAGETLPIDVVARSADIIRRFIEQYHEKLEETFLFPRFEKANQLVDLVATLRRQHLAGRRLTGTIQRLATAAAIQRPSDRAELTQNLRQFTRMYRPHEAREDTVLFPAFRRIVPPKEFDALGEQFEDKEHELFGKEGFEGIVQQVSVLERQLGTYDLDQFTPT